jgi:hypothetical protein
VVGEALVRGRGAVPLAQSSLAWRRCPWGLVHSSRMPIAVRDVTGEGGLVREGVALLQKVDQSSATTDGGQRGPSEMGVMALCGNCVVGVSGRSRGAQGKGFGGRMPCQVPSRLEHEKERDRQVGHVEEGCR